MVTLAVRRTGAKRYLGTMRWRRLRWWPLIAVTQQARNRTVTQRTCRGYPSPTNSLHEDGGAHGLFVLPCEPAGWTYGFSPSERAEWRLALPSELAGLTADCYPARALDGGFFCPASPLDGRQFFTQRERWMEDCFAQRARWMDDVFLFSSRARWMEGWFAQRAR